MNETEISKTMIHFKNLLTVARQNAPGSSGEYSPPSLLTGELTKYRIHRIKNLNKIKRRRMIKKAISIENEIEKLLNHQNLSVLIISFSTFRGDNKIRAGIMNVEKKLAKAPKQLR